MDLFLTMVNVGGIEDGFCAGTANIWQLIGLVLLIFKIVIPIILIILGMIDLGKAVVASKSDEVSKSVKSLAMRAVAAVIIFLIPTLIGFVMGFVSDFRASGAEDDFNVCKSCITRPNGDDCKGYAEAVWGNESPASGDSEEEEE